MKKVYFILTVMFLTLLVFQPIAKAEGEVEVLESKEFDTEKSGEFDTANIKKIIVNNENLNGNLTIEDDIISTVENGYIGEGHLLRFQDEEYFIFSEVLSGSGSATSIKVMHIDESESEVILETESMVKGEIIINNNEILVSEAIYKKDDSMAEPTSVNIKKLDLKGNDVSFSDGNTISLAEYESDYKSDNENINTFSSTANIPNPSPSEINRIISKKAVENGVPPEIVKAIAWQESTWRQFHNGEPLIGYDGKGIGIMQVTPGHSGLPEENDPEFQEKLMNDIEYNIDMGIKVLLQKWNWNGNILPTINDGSKDVIDNWYFAIMAYHGMSKVNDPAFNSLPYQDRIYNHMSDNKGSLALERFPINDLNINYINPASPNLMNFKSKMNYATKAPYTRSKHFFNKNDLISVRANVNIRKSPGGDIVTPLSPSEVVAIEKEIEYQNSSNVHHGWYKVKKQSGESGYIPASYIENRRLAGETRYDTAVEVSKEGWMSAKTVVIATGEDFPDALAGAPLAYKENAPILLTAKTWLPSQTINEIKRLGAEKVIILGGPQAVSGNVEKKIKELSVSVERISGNTRYDTAKKIAEKVGNSNHYIVANGQSFADALAIGPYAARNGIPILLTESTWTPGATKSLLTSNKKTTVIGGTTVVNNNVFNAMPNANRVSGDTRYHTAAEIVNRLNIPKNKGYLVNGKNFPDALTGSVLAAKENAPLLLTEKKWTPTPVKNLNTPTSFGELYTIGGQNAIETGVTLNY